MKYQPAAVEKSYYPDADMVGPNNADSVYYLTVDNSLLKQQQSCLGIKYQPAAINICYHLADVDSVLSHHLDTA